MASPPPYKRIVLKLSGEALKGSQEFGVTPEAAHALAMELKGVADSGIQLCVVVGGGNIFRGMAGQASGMNRTVADHIGMLATMINSLSLQDALEKVGVATRVMSGLRMDSVAEYYIRRRAMRHLEKGRVVIFACGTGNPFFSTDTAGALRASEIEADALFKATKVDGIYSEDPLLNPDAEFYSRLSYQDYLARDLRVMDSSAVALCRDNQLPIIVFNMGQPGNILRAARGEKIGTLIRGECDDG